MPIFYGDYLGVGPEIEVENAWCSITGDYRDQFVLHINTGLESFRATFRGAEVTRNGSNAPCIDATRRRSKGCFGLLWIRGATLVVFESALAISAGTSKMPASSKTAPQQRARRLQMLRGGARDGAGRRSRRGDAASLPRKQFPSHRAPRLRALPQLGTGFIEASEVFGYSLFPSSCRRGSTFAE